MRLLLVVFLALLIVGCDRTSDKPVEVLGSRSGILVKTKDDKIDFKQTDLIDLNERKSAAWFAYVRTNKETIKYTEKVQLSGPTKWNIERPTNQVGSNFSYRISDDKSTAFIVREVPNRAGYLHGIWGMYEDEPKGKLKIEVTIEGKEKINFEWNLN
jgi:hypothetical protein